MLTGSLVAIVTPMCADGAIDYPALRALIDWHIEQGTAAICVAGTTGEASTLSFAEQCELATATVQHVNGRVPVIAGTSANSTSEAIELSRIARDAGVDFGLSATPGYNNPSQEGLYRHYQTIAESVDLPQLLYNVPGRTGVNLNNETVLRLAQLPNIVGIKDATGDISSGTDLLRRAPPEFAIYAADDATALALMLLGAHGTFSVTANVVPGLMHEMNQAALRGDLARANAINRTIFPLHKALFVETSPIPVKWALAEMGRISTGIRLPLTQLTEAGQLRVRAALKEAGH